MVRADVGGHQARQVLLEALGRELPRDSTRPAEVSGTAARAMSTCPVRMWWWPSSVARTWATTIVRRAA